MCVYICVHERAGDRVGLCTPHQMNIDDKAKEYE